jgi:chemotaxis receptor (MCP) glutamine deamidase CheD
VSEVGRFLRPNPHFGKPERYIGPGEFYSSGDDIVISTLLGSCIAVSLHDPVAKVGGLNHFMLPTRSGDRDSAKYGVNAMELLINDLMKKGAARARFRAKVFGGGSMLSASDAKVFDVPKMNIDFAFQFLELEASPWIPTASAGPIRGGCISSRHPEGVGEIFEARRRDGRRPRRARVRAPPRREARAIVGPILF